MRCDDVTQELSAPSDSIDPTALAAHLASCPRCALWGEKVEKMDRLWEATRPVEPEPAEFDVIWARVALAADSLPATPSRWFRPVHALTGLAMAAALLIGVGVWSQFGRPGTPKPSTLEPNIAKQTAPDAPKVSEPTDDERFASLGAPIEIEPGTLSVIQIKAGKVKVDVKSDDDPPPSGETFALAGLDIHGAMESESGKESK